MFGFFCLLLLMGGLAAIPEGLDQGQRVQQAQAALAEARREVLPAELARLTTDYRVAPRVDLGPETPLSRECYRRLLRYVRYSQPQMRPWPFAAGCRFHKRDGHREWEVRQNATVALAYALLSAYGNYDAAEAGTPRRQVEAEARALVRYLALTHKANFLPTGDGRPWGNQWQSAFWAGIAGQAAWLIWEQLDDETKVLVARMVVHEANRFHTRPPDSGEWRDTKAEENAWNSEVIALAACMFPQHPRAELWAERAIVYMMNAFSEARDHEDTTLVDGRPVKEWVTTVCVHPDHTLENHGRVHPDYLATFTLNLRNALLYGLAGREVPQAAFHHAADAFRVLKHLTATNGGFFYVNGQDWWPHRNEVGLMAAGFMSALTGDREAAFLERAALAQLAKMHARFDNGRLWDPREFNYANAEEEMMARYAELYLLHRLFGGGPEPVTEVEFRRAQSGVRTFDIGGFVTHRTATKFVSFAWVNGAMGLVYPDDDTWFTAPWERGLVGRIECAGVKDTRPEVTARHLATDFGGFALTAQIRRCGGKVRQFISLTSLPEGPVVYVEQLRAEEEVRVQRAATGALGILNEDAGTVHPNRRLIYHAQGEETLVGAAEAPERWLVWRSPWVNVDDKLGLLVHVAGQSAYRDVNQYARSRLQEELFANFLTDLGLRRAGEVFSEAVVVLFPGQHHTDTADEVGQWTVERVSENAWQVRGDGWRITAIFDPSHLRTEVRRGLARLKPGPCQWWRTGLGRFPKK